MQNLNKIPVIRFVFNQGAWTDYYSSPVLFSYPFCNYQPVWYGIEYKVLIPVYKILAIQQAKWKEMVSVASKWARRDKNAKQPITSQWCSSN